MRQQASDPEPLIELVADLKYKAHWQFRLIDIDRGQGSVGFTLEIHITTPDSYHPERMRGVIHYFIVPAASYDYRSWRRWLFDQILLVETHEAMEFYQIASGQVEPEDSCSECAHRAGDHDGRDSTCTSCTTDAEPDSAGRHRFKTATPRYERPYAPSHGPGNDPYMIREVGTIEDVRTSFRGDLNDR